MTDRRTTSLERSVRRVLGRCRRQRLFARGDRVLVGVDGGVASLGLLGFLVHSAHELGIESIAVAAIEQDFDELSDDAEHVADLGRLARQLGLTFHAVRPADSGARVRILPELRAIATESGYRRIAVAPVQEDDAARVLAEILRHGSFSKVRGLAPKLRGGVVRPLLSVDRSEAAAMAALLGVEIVLPPREAPGRKGVEAVVAAQVLPRLRALSPGSAAALAHFGRECRSARRLLARDATAALRASASSEGFGLEFRAFEGLRGAWIARMALAALCPDAAPATRDRDAASLLRAVREPRTDAVVLHGAVASFDRRAARVTVRRRGATGR